LPKITIPLIIFLQIRKTMKRKATGHYVSVSTVGENCNAFIPNPLPPNPPLVWDDDLLEQQQSAALALGRLDGIGSLLPDPNLFLYSYIRKEAVLSSQIEGTQSSLSDLLAFENNETPGVPVHDVQEVSNYVAAMEHGLKRLRNGFPLSLRLIREIHAVLLKTGRGSAKQPGEFRTSQNWIGGTRPGNARYVPPPADTLNDCMGTLEKFFHDKPTKTPLLTKAALSHVQFETIHPFLDGNGRVGRLLITFLLCSQGALSQPMLYLSLFFKQNRQTYYDLLQKVRAEGDWESWLSFFFQGIKETSDEAASTAHRLLKLFAVDREKIQGLKKSKASVMQVHHALQITPLVSSLRLAGMTKLTPATIYRSLELLVHLDIVRETTGGQRNRLFAYDKYLKTLNKETEGDKK